LLPPAFPAYLPANGRGFTTMTDTPAPQGTGTKRIELTLRALVLGCILAAIFTAANTYLGLQVA